MDSLVDDQRPESAVDVHDAEDGEENSGDDNGL